MRLAITSAFAALALCTCAGPATPVQVKGVEPSDEAGVAGCKYLDTVMGTSGWYGVNAGLGMSNARTEALNQALAVGGNRVVWVPTAQNYGSTQAHAKVYKCG